MRFSIVVVCLNPGKEFEPTIQSILNQKFTDYEIIIKDGGSNDGTLERIPDDQRICLIKAPDKGIYDAMNQALEAARGEYIYFLNCGDYLYDENVLGIISSQIDNMEKNEQSDKKASVIYGNLWDRMANAKTSSNPVIDEFACYRNVPCHQTCFYNREMLLMHPFITKYKVRADYEQFLWCFYIAKAKMIFVDEIIASYMGGGFSESKANKKQSAMEHSEIVENYMPHSHIVRYKMRMILTLAPLRGVIARNPVTGKIYNKLKSLVYDKKGHSL